MPGAEYVALNPLCQYFLKKESLFLPQYSYARQAFTVNILFGDRVKEADFYGLISGEKHDKFEMSGITPINERFSRCAVWQRVPLVLECKVIHTLEIGVHTEFVGEILDIKAEDYLLDERGKIDTGKLDPILYTPEAGEYYGRGDYLGRSYKIGKSIISE